MYPEDSVQSIIEPDPWWVNNAQGKICRGSIIFAFIPHVDQVPYTFEPIGRNDPREHETAEVKVEPLKVSQPLRQTDLPVAAMTLYHGEVWGAYKCKKRPCLVFGTEKSMVDKALTRGKPNHSTAPTFLVAPYYGADRTGQRAGYSEAFTELVRHCEYPQFHWDMLPIGGPKESILRLDHLQPIGAHHEAYQVSEHMLSESAMDILDDMLRWLIWGGLPEDSLILTYKNILQEHF